MKCEFSTACKLPEHTVSTYGLVKKLLMLMFQRLTRTGGNTPIWLTWRWQQVSVAGNSPSPVSPRLETSVYEWPKGTNICFISAGLGFSAALLEQRARQRVSNGVRARTRMLGTAASCFHLEAETCDRCLPVLTCILTVYLYPRSWQ